MKTRLKHLATWQGECTSSNKRPYVALEHLESWTGKLVEGTVLPVRTPAPTGMATAEPGDVLFGKLRPYLAKSWVVNQPVLASTELMCLRPQGHLDSRWLGYLATSVPFVEWAAAASDGTKMPRTSWEKINQYQPWVPPLSEQREIADYLDTETTRIDALISKKRRLIALLESRLVVLAEDAVTGLDVGQATGIPSLPEVPSSWSVKRNKVFMREVNRKSPDGSGEMLSVSHITGVTPRSEKTVYMFEAESTVGYKQVSPGDLVINTMWAWMGAAGVSRVHGIVSPAYGVYEIDQTVMMPEFYDILVRTPAYVAEMTRFSRGVTSSRLRLYPDEFLRLSAPVPPTEIQKSIVDRCSADHSATIQTCRFLAEQVELLQERRQVLITTLVTGETPVPRTPG